jgi:hypothetical protein
MVLVLTAAVCLAAGAALAADAPAKPPAEAQKGPQPKFNPPGGVFAKPISLRLTVPAAGAVVRFTLDGSDPTEKAEAFREDLRLTATTLLKARVFKGTQPAGPTVSQTYTVIEPELLKFRSNLPVVILNTFGREITHSEKVRGSISLMGPQAGGTSMEGVPQFDGRGDLHVRGNSSLRYLKRSYGCKLFDDSGSNRSASLLGLPKDNDWVLYAPYPDKTLIRDVLAYDLSRQMGQYASHTKFVEVFVNQVGGKLSMRHYTGVFVLEEKIKRGKDRVNVQKLRPEDSTEPNITGGYVFKKDHGDTWGEVTPTVDGRPMGFGGNSGPRYGYPTGPGGFPGDPNGFQPPVGGTRRAGDNSRGGGQTVAPDSTTFFDRLRLALGGQEGGGPPPPPQPGVQPPRGRDEVRVYREDATPRENGGMDGFRMSLRNGGSGVEETFRTSHRNEFFYVEPKAEEITPAQKTWLRKHLNEFEQALYGENFRDPATGYAAYIDVDSFIDHHLMVEVTKNIDGFRFSTFYQKDRGGKIRMQPIWDWNLSFGNANGKQGWMPEYWYWPQLDDSQYSWFRRLFEDPDFAQRYVDRWGQLRATVFSVSNMFTRIDSLVAELGDARKRNFERWPILSRRIWPNTYLGHSYEDEINFMKEFIRKRTTWIDQQFVTAPVATVSGEGSPTARLTAPAGQIYFTLDGSDPRQSGGGVSPKAQAYQAPVARPEPGRLWARARVDERWSPLLRF